MSFDTDIYAIEVKNLTKKYRIFETPGQSFLYHVFKTDKGRDFVALDNVSFDVKRGESFGIIGKNGSGKSTLLQILAGIIKQTDGTVKVNGRVAALLELGSGFDPESTGYENIYMNAAILGISKEEIDKKVGEIVEFADIGDFIGQPVKTYSSGMFVRLAFAVAINVDADVLLIDEALAVGDVFFRQKCYDKLNKLKEKGVTIILVSHGMNEVEQFCDRTLLLDSSEPKYLGDSKTAVNYYYLLNRGNDIEPKQDHLRDRKNEDISKSLTYQDSDTYFNNGWHLEERTFLDISESDEVTNGGAKFLNVGIFDKDGFPRNLFEQGEEVYFYSEIALRKDIQKPLSGVEIINHKGIIVHGKDMLQTGTILPDTVNAGTVLRFLQVMKLDVEIGEYTVNYGCSAIDTETYEKRMYLKQEEVDSKVDRLSVLVGVGVIAVVERKVGNPMKQAFHGLCNIPGEILLELK